MPGTRLRFGLFEFEPDSKELRRDGRVVRLQAQPSQVLGCLLQHCGDVVSREELRGAVWPTGTFVDFERGLNFCIAQIRGALQDDAVSPRFIRTIPKRGYQFIAPVEVIAAEKEVTPQEQAEGIGAPTENVPRVSGLRVWRVLAVSGFALTVFAAGYWSRNLAIMTRNPIVAIARFDNETGDPTVSRVADSLTDDVVTNLTSASRGQYRVIGNASILRVAREQRNLTNIAATLGASYVVLGQVQRSGGRTRILAHLIHLPEQTHVSVVRMERDMMDPLTLEWESAERIAAQFAPPISSRSTKAVSPLPVKP